jgi:hypothetical protein
MNCYFEIGLNGEFYMFISMLYYVLPVLEAPGCSRGESTKNR